MRPLTREKHESTLGLCFDQEHLEHYRKRLDRTFRSYMFTVKQQHIANAQCLNRLINTIEYILHYQTLSISIFL